MQQADVSHSYVQLRISPTATQTVGISLYSVWYWLDSTDSGGGTWHYQSQACSALIPPPLHYIRLYKCTYHPSVCGRENVVFAQYLLTHAFQPCSSMDLKSTCCAKDSRPPTLRKHSEQQLPQQVVGCQHSLAFSYCFFLMGEDKSPRLYH